MFNKTEIEYSRRETHLRIERTSDGKASEAVTERIKVGRRTAYDLMGAGLHGMDGITPHISKTLILVYVDPAVLYGLESLCMSTIDLKELDKSQRLLLHQIQPLPDSTAIRAIYLLPGMLPHTVQVHQKILSLYNTIIHRPASIEHEVMTRQLAMKDTSSNSWTSQLRKILFQYHLPSPIQLANNPAAKSRWKITVKMAIRNYWNKALKEEA